VLFNLYNRNYIIKTNPTNILQNTASLYKNISVYSVDNEYYLTPPTNYLSGKGWLRDPGVSDADAVRRVPGYSVLYLMGLICFGENGSLLFLIFLQTFLYGLFTVCMYEIVRMLNLEFSGLKPMIIVLFALPLFYSFTFFTITEGVNLFFSGFLIYFTIKAKTYEKHKELNYFFASVFFAIIILTRPLGAIGGLLFILILTESKKKVLSLCLMASVLPFILLGIWTYRNYKITNGELIILEKAYNPKSLDYFKIDLKGMADLYKCWGASGMEMAENVLWFTHSVTERRDSSDNSINAVYMRLPQKAKAVIKKEDFFEALRLHQLALFEKLEYNKKLIEMPPEYLPSQVAAYQKYKLLKLKYISAYPFDYYVLTPLRYLRQMMLHSNTSHIAFLNAQNLSPLFILLKGSLFLIHLLLYFIGFIVLFIKKPFIIKLISLTTLVAICFFIFYFKEVEQRYMNPFLPFLLISFFYFISWLKHKIQSR